MKIQNFVIKEIKIKGNKLNTIERRYLPIETNKAANEGDAHTHTLY